MTARRAAPPLRPRRDQPTTPPAAPRAHKPLRPAQPLKISRAARLVHEPALELTTVTRVLDPGPRAAYNGLEPHTPTLLTASGCVKGIAHYRGSPNNQCARYEPRRLSTRFEFSSVHRFKRAPLCTRQRVTYERHPSETVPGRQRPAGPPQERVWTVRIPRLPSMPKLPGSPGLCVRTLPTGRAAPGTSLEHENPALTSQIAPAGPDAVPELPRREPKPSRSTDRRHDILDV